MRLLFLVIFMLFAAACGSDDDVPSLSASRDDGPAATTDTSTTAANISPISDLPDPQDTLSLPPLPDMPGQVYVTTATIQGRNRGALWQVAFDGEPAAAILDVRPEAILLAPDRRQFGIQGQHDESPRNAVWLVGANGVAAEVRVNSPAFPVTWSPEGDKVIVGADEMIVLGVDGSTQRFANPFGPPTEIAWDADGQIVAGYHGQAMGLSGVMLYGGAEPEILLDNREGLHNWALLLDARTELEELGHALEPGYRFLDQAWWRPDGNLLMIPPVNPEDSLGLCETWTLDFGPPGETQTILTFDDTHALALGSSFADGSIMLQRFYKPTCSHSESVEMEAIRVWPEDGTAEVLVTGIPMAATTLNMRLGAPDHLIALSPHDRYLLWLINDGTTTSSLHIKDIETDSDATLAIVPNMKGVVWLAE